MIILYKLKVHNEIMTSIMSIENITFSTFSDAKATNTVHKPHTKGIRDRKIVVKKEQNRAHLANVKDASPLSFDSYFDSSFFPQNSTRAANTTRNIKTAIGIILITATTSSNL